METAENKRGKKLLYYLGKLKEKELQDFHDYLQSPLLGNSPQFARMLKIIQARVLGTERGSIDADLFREEFFPGQALDEKKIKYIRIRLVQMTDKVLDFISFMDFRGDRNAKDIHLLKAMHTRGWDRYFEKVHAEVEAKPAVKKDGEYLMYKLWRAVILNEYGTERLGLSEEKMGKVIDSTDDLFIHLRMKYVSAGSGQLVTNMFANELSILGLNRNWNHSPESRAYVYAYWMNHRSELPETESDLYYAKIKEFLRSPEDNDVSELVELFYYSANYCFRRITQGATNFRRELTELYDIILGTGTLEKAGLIPKGLYKNFVTNACRVGEITWAENFNENWKKRIAGDENHLIYFHNQAHISLNLKQYDKVVEILYNRINLYEDPSFGPSARVNICRALWEKGDFAWLLSNLEAFRQFIMRLKNLPKNERSGHEGFIRYLSRMAKAKLGPPDQTLKKLQKTYSELIDSKEHNRLLWLHKTLLAEIETTTK